MRIIAKIVLLCAPLLAAMPAQAQAPTAGLACMDASYTANQLADLGRLGPLAQFADGANNAAFDQIANMGMEAVIACASEHGWSEESMLQAAWYEISRVSEAAYRLSDELTAQELALFDTALARGNRDRLWQIIEDGVVAGLAGTEANASPMDQMLMGVFVRSAGLENSTAMGRKVGVLLGFMGMQRVASRQFAALEESMEESMGPGN